MAEAIVVRSDGRRVRVEADVLADGRRIASFEANSGVALSPCRRDGPGRA